MLKRQNNGEIGPFKSKTPALRQESTIETGWDRLHIKTSLSNMTRTVTRTPTYGKNYASRNYVNM